MRKRTESPLDLQFIDGDGDLLPSWRRPNGNSPVPSRWKQTILRLNHPATYRNETKKGSIPEVGGNLMNRQMECPQIKVPL